MTWIIVSEESGHSTIAITTFYTTVKCPILKDDRLDIFLEKELESLSHLFDCEFKLATNKILASTVWHYAIICAQSHQLESFQKRVVHVLFSFTRGMSYPNVYLLPV